MTSEGLGMTAHFNEDGGRNPMFEIYFGFPSFLHSLGFEF
jgi:hypothetical protein